MICKLNRVQLNLGDSLMYDCCDISINTKKKIQGTIAATRLNKPLCVTTVNSNNVPTQYFIKNISEDMDLQLQPSCHFLKHIYAEVSPDRSLVYKFECHHNLLTRRLEMTQCRSFFVLAD